MKVYVVTVEWESAGEHVFDVIEVFTNEKKAMLKLQSLREDDLNWICDNNCVDEDELEENIFEDWYSYVRYDDCWSSVTIHQTELNAEDVNQ